MTFAVLGAVLAVPITLFTPLSAGMPPAAAAVFAVAGALGAGRGRWVVVVRARRQGRDHRSS